MANKTNNLVTKSNSLIEARYRLTLEEQRLILYLVSMIQPKDEDFAVYTISVKDFMELTDVKSKDVYRQFKDMSEHLMSKPLVIRKENSTLVMNWLSSAEYYSGQGKIEVSFDPKLKPYLLKLKANFTSYKLKNVIMLKSFYSIRIYELLKQYERLGERLFTLIDLREYLSIDESFYPMYSNFKQKVLNVAYKELKEKSDIYFEFEEIKQGLRVEKIRFIIHKKSEILKDDEKINLMNEPSPLSSDHQAELETLKKIIEQSLSDKDLLAIYAAAAGDMARIERRYEEAKRKRQLTNLVGFMIWACGEPEESFQKTAGKGTSRYNNFKGRKRDYQEIERMERELLVNELNNREGQSAK